MARPDGQRLRGVCEAFRSALRTRIPLTRFRLDLILPEGRTESLLLVDPEPIPQPDECGRMPIRAMQQRVAVSVSIADEDGPIGLVTVEHESRESEAKELQQEVERVARMYVPALRAWADGDPTGTQARR